MSLDENISAFIGRIYEGAYDQAAWDACAKELMKLIGAHFYFTHLFDAANPTSDTLTRLYGLEDSAMADGVAEYFEGFYQDDPSLKFALENPHLRFCDTSRLVPDGNVLTENYLTWMKSRFGSANWLVGYTALDDGITFGASLHPHHTAGPLPERNLRLFRLLFDHMERALRLAARPPSLGSMDDALFYIDRGGKVREASPAAAAVLAEADGLTLADGHLCAASAGDTLRLDRAIRSAVDALLHGGAGGAVRLPRPSGKRDLLVVASPFPLQSSPTAIFQPAAVVRIKRQTDPRPLAAVHRELFGLTHREAEVADLLAQGHSLESLANTLGMATNTARVHLHALFRKTGTNRQADLVRMLIG